MNCLYWSNWMFTIMKRIRIQSCQVHPTMLTIRYAVFGTHKIHMDKQIYTRWNGPSVTKWNPENCKNFSSKLCLWLCTASVHNTKQNCSNNLPSYLQTNTRICSIRGITMWTVACTLQNKVIYVNNIKCLALHKLLISKHLYIVHWVTCCWQFTVMWMY